MKTINKLARFYSQIQGSRGMASRVGTPSSGMWAHVRGLNVGAKITCHVDEKGNDYLKVYKTTGLRGCESELIATLRGIGVEA